MKEVKADAEELGNELFHGVADTSHHMLKVCIAPTVVLFPLIATKSDATELPRYNGEGLSGRGSGLCDMLGKNGTR